MDKGAEISGQRVGGTNKAKRYIMTTAMKLRTVETYNALHPTRSPSADMISTSIMELHRAVIISDPLLIRDQSRWIEHVLV
jgi:hypothetical protein